MFGTEPPGERADHVVIGSAFAGRLDQLRSEQQVLAAAGQIDVVVLDEHGGGQDHVGNLRRVGHELLVHAHEQIVAREAALDRVLFGGDGNRIGVLNEHRGDRRPAAQCVLVAGQDRADARLIEHADRGIGGVLAFDQAFVEMEDRVIVVKSAAAFIAPGAGDRGDAACGMHVGGTVARAREAVAEPEISALGLADEAREGFDRCGGTAGDARCPFRIARA